MANQSFLQGYMTAAQAQEIINQKATHIGVFVNIYTDDSGNTTYDILANGVDSQKEIVGPVLYLCPTPCPTQPGHHP